jgi:hypothetical protein
VATSCFVLPFRQAKCRDVSSGAIVIVGCAEGKGGLRNTEPRFRRDMSGVWTLNGSQESKRVCRVNASVLQRMSGHRRRRQHAPVWGSCTAKHSKTVLRHPCADHPPITETFTTFTGPQPNGYYSSVALQGLRVGHRAARASGRTYRTQTGAGTIELSSCENTALEGRHISIQCGI